MLDQIATVGIETERRLTADHLAACTRAILAMSPVNLWPGMLAGAVTSLARELDTADRRAFVTRTARQLIATLDQDQAEPDAEPVQDAG